jgi:cytochrome oxidase Cu insertion factor (SCO1/SenC/PrrC family)
MKLQLLALAVLAGGLTVSALAQQKDTPLSEQDYQKLVALGKKNDEAWSKSDAAALGSLYTENAEFVTPAGILTGKEAIQKRYLRQFQGFRKEVHPRNHSKQARRGARYRREHSVGTWTMDPDVYWRRQYGQRGPR